MTTMSETKKCRICKKPLSLSEFSIKHCNKTNADGEVKRYKYINFACHNCQRDYNREYMQKVRKAYHKSKGEV